MKTPPSIRLHRDRPLAAEERVGGTPFYVGTWVDDEPCVTITRGQETVSLEPRREQSAAGFAWGYAGPGCAHLAFAILADYLADEADGEARARRLCDAFHTNVIAGLPNSWALSGEQVSDFLGLLDL